jgi:Ca2+-binding EF-hand superfamily protein
VNARFTPKELQLLKKRFNKLAKGKGSLNKEAFQESLGLLGLEHATFLSDRLFNIIDYSGD